MTPELKQLAQEVIERFIKEYDTDRVIEESKLKHKTIQLKFKATSKYVHNINLQILLVEPSLYYFEYEILSHNYISENTSDIIVRKLHTKSTNIDEIFKELNERIEYLAKIDKIGDSIDAS